MPGLIALAAFLAPGEAPKVQEVLPGVWRVRYGTTERLTPLTDRSAPVAQKARARR